MSVMKRLEHEITDSIPGAIFDLFMGRGGDGVPHSSAESYYRPEETLQPVINIQTDNITLNQRAEDAYYEAIATQQQELEQGQRR